MNRGTGQVQSRLGGYTIVETLIFLAVSAVMFLIALQFVGGQQNKVNFINSVRDFETKLTDIANDISTGYFQGSGVANIHCGESATGPVFDIGSVALKGSNKDCVFIGTVIKLGEGSDNSKVTQYTLAGLRLNSSGLPVSTLSEAKPQLMQITGVSISPSPFITSKVGYGVTIECVRVGNASQPCTANNAAIGFITKFTGTTPNGGNGIQTDLLKYPSVILSNTADDSVISINDSTNYTATNLNPADGITICLKGAATKQYALVHIGGKGNGLTTSAEIKSYPGSTLCS